MTESYAQLFGSAGGNLSQSSRLPTPNLDLAEWLAGGWQESPLETCGKRTKMGENGDVSSCLWSEV